jgi:hypothetical protein
MTFDPVINTQTDLENAWRQLMKPLGFGRESLWLLFIGEDSRPFPHLTEIPDSEVPPHPDRAAEFAEFLADMIKELRFTNARVAALRSRPGHSRVTARDRAWAEYVYAACRTAGIPCETVHVASDEDILPMPWDELGVSMRAARTG